MIAACPRCKTRYRIEREKMRPEGVRLRCARCEALFRVRPPDTSAAPAAAADPAAAQQGPIDPGAAAAQRPADPGPAAAQRPVDAGAGALERTEDPAAAALEQPLGAPGPAGVASSAAASEPLAGERPDDPAADVAGAGPESEPEPRDGSRPAICVAIPDPEVAKATAECLERRGMAPFVVQDGVEAILEIQRRLPSVVVLAATLPKMFGFQVCELVKRNESLRSIQVVLVGAIHHKDRYRRPPGDLYGADAYLEQPDLPEALEPLIDRLTGSAMPPAGPANAPQPPPLAAEPAVRSAPAVSPAAPEPAPAADPLPAPADAATAPAPAEMPAPPLPTGAPAPRVEPPAPPEPATAAAPEPATAAAPEPAAADSAPADALSPERDKAERLARIIVSDIVLYNEVRFNEALRMGNVVEALSAELAEGRALFAERVDERVRAERDHLAEELQRVADSRAAR